MEIFPTTDAQQLYKQWQDGKLLDMEERKALGPTDQFDTSAVSFSELLKSSGDRDS